MSPLEEALQEQKNLVNKGYSVEQIQCAALQLIHEEVREINAVMQNTAEFMMTPTIEVHDGDD